MTWREGKIVPNTKPERISGKNVGLAVKFRTKANEKVLLKVAKILMRILLCSTNLNWSYLKNSVKASL